MKPLSLFIFLLLTIKLHAQKSTTIDLTSKSYPANQIFIVPFESNTIIKKKINFGVHFLETTVMSYKKNKIGIFLFAENLLGEYLKPEPTVNKSGFHYSANPLFEIEETKGNTGYIKLGINIQI
jgi:hypothetical protein